MSLYISSSRCSTCNYHIISIPCFRNKLSIYLSLSIKTEKVTVKQILKKEKKGLIDVVKRGKCRYILNTGQVKKRHWYSAILT